MFKSLLGNYFSYFGIEISLIAVMSNIYIARELSVQFKYCIILATHHILH